MYYEVSRLDNKCRRNCLSIWAACCISNHPLRGRIRHKLPRHAASVKLGAAVQLQPAEWLHMIVTFLMHLVVIAAILKKINRKTKNRCVFFLSSSNNRNEISGLLSYKVGVVHFECDLKDHVSFCSGVPGGGGFKLPLPRNSEGPQKSCQTQPDCEKC